MKLLISFIKYTKLVNEFLLRVFRFLIVNLIWPPAKQTFIYGLPTAALYTLFQLVVKENQFQSLGVYVLTPLAVLIAFTGLLYARARAVDGEGQKVCVSSADQAFKACICYSIAVIWGFVMATWSFILKGSHIELPKEALYIFYAPSFLGVAFAYIEIFQAVSKVWQLIKNEK